MNWVRNIVCIFIVAAVTLLPIHTVAAETFVMQGGSITVQTKVAKTHYILVDSRGTITEITSNTTEEAKPRIFLQRIALGNERPMTDDIYRQYQAILPNGKTSSVGTIYKQSEIAKLPLFSTPAAKNSADLLAFMKQ